MIIRTLLLSALLAWSADLQQTPTRDTATRPTVTGTSLISGTVLNELTGRPLRRATVSVSASDRNLRLAAVTDDNGRFTIADLPDGRYSLIASKPGYVSVNFGATRPRRPGTPIALAPGERRTGLALRLPPGAVITGTVRTRAGEPVRDARVSVLRRAVAYNTGLPTLEPERFGLGQITDDRGQYRVFGLPAGEYFVVVAGGIGVARANELRETSPSEVEWATRQLKSSTTGGPMPQAGRAVEYAPVFYPGAPSQSGAATVSLKAGEERAGVDVLFDLVPTAKITGTVVSTAGELPPTLQVNVIAHETIPGIPFSGFGTARVDASGRFATPNLVPGEYTITVRAAPGRAGGPLGASAALFGLTSVTVSGTDVDTTITLAPGATVSGRLVFNGSTLKPPADLSKIRVSLSAERDGRPTLGVGSVSADASGAFTLLGATPGRYRLSASTVGGWQLRTATVHGQDVTDLPFQIGSADIAGAEIVFTDLQTEIAGDLLNAEGRPAPDYFIIVFPDDKTYWVPQSRRIQSVRPGADGHFKVANLPAGDYRIAAVTDVEQGEWFNPAFLAELVGASTKITLAEGEKKVQSLRIKSGIASARRPATRER